MKEHDKDDCGKFSFVNTHIECVRVRKRMIYRCYCDSAQFMKEIKQLKEKGKPDAMKDRTDGLVAAMRIQKVWRGFTTRRKTRHGKVEEMYLIGMIPRPERNNEALLDHERKV